jgi:MFS family permease
MSALGTAIAQIVVGLIENLFGRKLFWLFVAVGGFLVGWFLAPGIWSTIHEGGTLELWVRLVIGLGAAVVLGFLAFKFTRIMVSLAGFFIFAAAAVLVVDYFGGNVASGTRNYWIAYGCGGVVGAVILGLLFEAGAAVDGVMYFFTPENPTVANPAPAKWIEGVAVGVLFIIGLVVQIMTRRKRIGSRAT